MRAALEPLVETLLYEGYALYPYTPGAVKNATPTPFGIVYPPIHARGSNAGFDHLRLECIAEAPAGAACDVEVRFLHATGTGNEATARSLAVDAFRLRASAPAQTQRARWGGDAGEPALDVALEVVGEPRGEERWHVRVELRNETAAPSAAAADRWSALPHAMLSVHVVLELGAGRFVSPLETEGRGCRNVNTWPVLASPDDDVLVGAAIVLPDHPELSPQSLGSLFDGTEIEEALWLHLQTLSPDELAAIAESDPTVRDAVDRARTAAAPEVERLHGALREAPRDAGAQRDGGPAAPDPREGVPRARVGATTLERGGRVRLRLDRRRNDPYACLLDGRPAVIERIHRGYDDRVYLAVTLEDDPGQALFRESGRFLWFFPDEVEVLDT